MKLKKLLSRILCFTLLLCIPACGSEADKKQKGTYPEFLTNHDWEYNTLSCTEILHFDETGGFSYYETCGNPVGNSDCYETYTYDEDKGVVTAYGYDDSVEDLEISVLRYTQDSLLVSIEGKIKEFYTYQDVPGVIGDMYDKVEGYSAYMAIGDINDGMIETAPPNFDADAGGLKLVRQEKLSETASFYYLNEEVIHVDGEEDKITTEFTELRREDVAPSEDNSFSAGYVWYNDNLEITKIVYYGLLEIWE